MIRIFTVLLEQICINTNREHEWTTSYRSNMFSMSQFWLISWRPELSPRRPKQRWPPEADLDTCLPSPAECIASHPLPPSTARTAEAWRGTGWLQGDTLRSAQGMKLLLISAVTMVAVFTPAAVRLHCRVTSAALWAESMLIMWPRRTADRSQGRSTCLCVSILLLSCWQDISKTVWTHASWTLDLPAVMRKTPPSLYSLGLMQGTPQTRKKLPARVEISLRLMRTVQNLRNTAIKK